MKESPNSRLRVGWLGREGEKELKVFNTSAVCIPEKHYMVDPSEKTREIKRLVDAGKYFTINRARQYGKTTTLNALSKLLIAQYVVISP